MDEHAWRIRLVELTRLCALAGVVSASLALAGCQHADLAQELTAGRWARVGKTVDTFVSRERGRPAHVRNTFVHIGEDWSRSIERSGRNRARVATFFQDDVERWHNNQPKYAGSLTRILIGKPEMLELRAIELFY